MTETHDNLSRYRSALAELTAALREAGNLADALAHLAGQLRGAPTELHGPHAYPPPARVLAALRRVSRARLGAQQAWERLPADKRKDVPRPASLQLDDD